MKRGYSERPAGPKRILVVDDDVALTRLFQLNLQDETNYEVRIENSGRAGLAAVPGFRPDLILLDVVMPGMSGREMAAALRADPVHGTTPVIFVTGIAPEGSPESWEKQLDGYQRMIKPFTIASIIAAIEATPPGANGIPGDAV